MSEQIVKIGDSRELIKELPDNYIDCVITSSPYWMKRDYKTPPLIWDGDTNCQHEWFLQKGTHNIGRDDKYYGGTVGASVWGEKKKEPIDTNFCAKCGAWKGSLGQEPSPQLFVKHLVDIFASLKPKLKDTGSMWINLGDSYSGNGDGGTRTDKEKAESILDAAKSQFRSPKSEIPAKSLCLIPERFAIEMINNNFILRNIIIWHKLNHMPGPWKDRLTNSYEYVYHFVKKPKYFYDLDLIREPLSASSIQRISQPNVMNQKGGFKQDELRGNPTSGNASRCNKMVQSLAMKYGNANTGINNKEPYTANNPHRTRLYEGKFSEVPEDCEQYGSPRARTQRKPYAVQERTKDFVEYRENLPSLDELKEYLNSYRISKNLTIDDVEQKFGNMAAHHWFSGECYSSPEDWLKLKKIIGLDDEYDEVMTTEYQKPSDKVNHPLGRNPSDCWTINTKPYLDAHFACFPLELVKRPILSTCPKYICNKCGTPRERIYKPIPLPDSSLSYNSKYKDQDIGQAPQGFTRSNTTARERDQSRTIAKELYPDDKEAQQEYINYIHDHGGTTRQEFAGYSDCGCGTPFESGWVLDPFCGSGTTLEFCRQNGYNAIGMELNPDYLKLIKNRAMLNVPQIKKVNNVQEI